MFKTSGLVVGTTHPFLFTNYMFSTHVGFNVFGDVFTNGVFYTFFTSIIHSLFTVFLLVFSSVIFCFYTLYTWLISKITFN